MALSATLSISNATPNVGQKVTATLVVSNSGAGAVGIASITPQITVTSESGDANAVPCTCGQVALGPGQTTQIPASGSVTYTWDMFFQAPSLSASGSGTFTIGALVQGADGELIAPTAATVTVSQYAIT